MTDIPDLNAYVLLGESARLRRGGSCQRGLGPSPRGAAGDQDRATIEGEPLATPAEYADSCSGERPRAVCQVHPDATHGISEMSGARCRHSL